MHIDKRHYGKVKLDGLNIAGTAAWPGPIHMGHGEILPIVDGPATPEQRDAVLKIMSGQETEAGATFFQVFVSRCEKVHEPMFKPIAFAVELKSCKGHMKLPGVVDRATTAILNPLTSKPHPARLALRQGFEYTEAEFASGTVSPKAPIALSRIAKHAYLANLHLTGQGVVHSRLRFAMALLVVDFSARNERVIVVISLAAVVAAALFTTFHLGDRAMMAAMDGETGAAYAMLLFAIWWAMMMATAGHSFSRFAGLILIGWRLFTVWHAFQGTQNRFG
jgi:hypothetical protein